MRGASFLSLDFLRPINNQLILHERDSFLVTKSYNTLQSLPFNVLAKTKISFYSHVLLVYKIKHIYGERERERERERSLYLKSLVLTTLRKCLLRFVKIYKGFQNPRTLGRNLNTKILGCKAIH